MLGGEHPYSRILGHRSYQLLHHLVRMWFQRKDHVQCQDLEPVQGQPLPPPLTSLEPLSEIVSSG